MPNKRWYNISIPASSLDALVEALDTVVHYRNAWQFSVAATKAALALRAEITAKADYEKMVVEINGERGLV